MALAFSSNARADILPEGPSSSTGGALDYDARPGGHPDYRVIMRTDRSTTTESVGRFAGDLPVGMLTNPNAIPWSKRCPVDVFQASGFQEGPRCPESSRIGTSRVRLRLDVSPLTQPDPTLWFKLGLTSDNPLCSPTSIGNFRSCSQPLYLLQGDPEVPATVGTIVEPTPGFVRPQRVTAEVRPVTTGPDADLRLRFISSPIPNTILMVNNPTNSPTPRRPAAIEDIEMLLWGQLPKLTETEIPITCDFDADPECDPTTMVPNPACPRLSGTYPDYNGSWTTGTGIAKSYGYMGMEYLLPECRTGNYFVTNPTSPGPWTTHLYVRAHDTNTNADTDLTGNGLEFVKMPDVNMTPDDSQGPAALTSTATAAFTDSSRGGYPNLDVSVTNPGYANLNARGVDVPKKIVATLPEAVNVDVARTADVCEVADFNARNCADKARVGQVWIKTPLLADGLTGDAYIVRNTGDSNLPRLGLKINGAVKFNVLSSTRYVGASFNQIEATFDNIPQIGFSELSLRINGGKGGLLKTRGCQAGGKFLTDGGAVTFGITGYSGASTASAGSVFTADNCFSSSVAIKSPTKCVKSKFSIKPSIASTAEVSKVTVSSKGSKAVTSKKSPFKVTVKIGKKVKKGKKTKFTVKVQYKPQNGQAVKSVTKTGKFTRCK
ncbi:MAG: hypothetical protein QM648_07860 [Solirubrobacterales bacterium]